MNDRTLTASATSQSPAPSPTPTPAPAPSPSFPVWTFNIPVDIANQGFQIAIYGQVPPPSPQIWMYWNATTGAYVDFTGDNGQSLAPLNNATPDAGNYTSPVSYQVTLPGSQYLQSGVVAMFIGTSAGIQVTNGAPATPTTTTNPNDLYSLFELTYDVPPNGGSGPSLDIDISNVDQLGFTYTVSSSAPFPLSTVGSPVPQATVFSQFGTAFPASSPFNACLFPNRLLAPQDVLQAVAAPNPPSYLNPTGTPSTPEPFADNSYFYLASETSPSGETVPCPVGVFGGFLLSSDGDPQASGIQIGWQSGGTPSAYSPTNPSATGINLYRAAVAPADAGSPVPSAPTTGYTLLTGMSILDWNAQSGYLYLDDSPNTSSTQTPESSSYGFSALSTWFDNPLKDFFAYYSATQLTLYQDNQNGGQNGTLWMGSVSMVEPETGDLITTLTYIDQTGKENPIGATWQWGDGTQTYWVLQLAGCAYDASDLSNTSISGQTGLTQGEYQGAVVSIYFPYFTGNTGLATVTLPTTPPSTYSLPSAPSFPISPSNPNGGLENAIYGPSQMVFGCAGAFATPYDPDALAQQGTPQENYYPGLAQNALPNIENVIVSALNRGVATGYDFALQPQQYTCLFGLSEAPTVAASANDIPAGTYTYYLSGTLNNGAETAISWGQTVTFTGTSSVTLTWLPQSAALYTQVNIYRQAGGGALQLVGTVSNTSDVPATTFTDTNQLPSQPTNGAPYVFYPSWNNTSSPAYVPSNLFSAFLHQSWSADAASGISVNGLVYGYPFDDQGNFSTNINYGTTFPSSVTFNITSLS